MDGIMAPHVFHLFVCYQYGVQGTVIFFYIFVIKIKKFMLKISIVYK